ncbi:hypothetical protein C5F48_11500 [Cereibacter changlensis JA139]|uniref:CMP/dCMP-type deaminase domain-containing protein n=2 Tax=Cereibacter changlensis TaxID=402884 RepID=A0A2T4JUP4_9RHOB|nr:hypothetical protein C5F48_11500 [Cereibacter changlensis JA139]
MSGPGLAPLRTMRRATAGSWTSPAAWTQMPRGLSCPERSAPRECRREGGSMDQKAQASAGPSADERSAMNEAIDRALRAARESGKSGIAATVLKAGKVVATGENEVHLQCDPTQHAEMVAITRAAQVLGTTDLTGCVLISTLQPCEMCLSAFRFARMERVIFAATQAKVPEKYFAFPHLRLDDFQRGTNFTFVAGVGEELVLHLYATGDE